MKFIACLWSLLLLASPLAASAADYRDFDQPPHDYWKRAPKDRFSRWMTNLTAGRVELDYSGEKAFVASVLKSLDIPASSQMLLFSTTSLQLSLITPRTPRARYFSTKTSTSDMSWAEKSKSSPWTPTSAACSTSSTFRATASHLVPSAPRVA